MPSFRRSLLFLWIFSLVLGGSFLTRVIPGAAQDQKMPGKPSGGEEEEEKPSKPLKKVPIEEEEEKPSKPLKKVPIEEPKQKSTEPESPDPDDANVGVFRLDDVIRAASEARHPSLREFLKQNSVAHDILVNTKGKRFRILPVPLMWGKDRYPAEFGVMPLQDDNKTPEEGGVTFRQKTVSRIDPFEKLVVDEVTARLKNPPAGPSMADHLASCERLLAAVLFFHDSAREQNRRKGKAWDTVKNEVTDKLTEVRLARLKRCGVDKDWAKLKELSARNIELYKAAPKVLERIYASRLAEADSLLSSERVSDLERVRDLLGDYEARFPDGGDEVAKYIRTSLGDKARRWLKDAEKLMETNQAEARALLKAVEAIAPDAPSLRKVQQQLKSGYSVLVVGTQRLPEFMSPATARYDSEVQASSLIFESLFDAIPDDSIGIRFNPQLASDRPLVAAGSRDLPLVRNAEWAGPDKGIFEAADVEGTLRLLRKSPSWAAESMGWFDEPGYDPSEPGRIKLRFKVGHPDPRSLLTLKIQPARWLRQNSKTIDDVEFGRKPFGTGPYRLPSDYVPPTPGETPRDMVLISNPAYGKRAGKIGRPFIKEIRFTDVNLLTDPASEIRGDRVHIIPDVPTVDLPKYTADNNSKGKIRIITPVNNRRIYILAINNRRTNFQSTEFRRGLSLAIDRERVLTDVFRAGKSEYHKALTGPFPVGSWAVPRQAIPLFNRDLAQAKFKNYFKLEKRTTEIELIYPTDDPRAKPACEKIKTMIESAASNEEIKFTVRLEPQAPKDFMKRVGEEHRYDLAYVPFDYRNDWYPLTLGAFLDPETTGIGGRNFCGYLGSDTQRERFDDELGRLLTEARAYREPSKLEELAHKIHRTFNEASPFVPLWQLDRHMVMSSSVKPYLEGFPDEANPQLLDPSNPFTSISEWRVE